MILALGTAQWGMPYGIANRSGPPGDAEIECMLDLARSAGIDTLDTARAYGTSEERIGRLAGRSFRVVTKLAPDVWTDGTSVSEALARTRASIEQSRKALRRDRLDALLLHRAEHQTCEDGAIWQELLETRQSGRIGRLGISASSPEKAWHALRAPGVELVQVATSLLDQRLVKAGFFEEAARHGVAVHVRSIYLQGIAFMPVDDLPTFLKPLHSVLAAIDREGRSERADWFLAFALGLPVERLVLGCETPAQLEENLERMQGVAGLREIPRQWAVCDEKLVDPSNWIRAGI